MSLSSLAATPGLPPFFTYQAGQLTVEDVPLQTLARQHGTPLFVYSKAALLAALAAYQRGLAGRQYQICYAMKANPTLAIVQTLVQAGCGLDIVSGGELERALAVGADPAKVVFSGVGKTRTEMRRALDVGIDCFNVESRAEIDVLNQVALEMGLRAPVSLRVNPNVDPQTHPYISTGLKHNKFGIAQAQVLASYRHASACAGLRVLGIDCHIGSQITQVEPYLDALERVLDLIELIEAAGIPLPQINFGGGLGIAYHDETPPAADELWQRLLQRMDARGHGGRKILVEPGRSLVGNAGVCVTEVLYEKPGDPKNFLIVDAAMNDLPRPALYQAFHQIVALAPREQAPSNWEVVGPVCESGDWLGRERTLAAQTGDWLAVLSAGAYCTSMASNYNTRGRAAEVLVDGACATLIRARETAADQLRLESLLPSAQG
ncbi:diaminopimelate decarboxylase [Hydrogenophaga sp.]|uniref:diaminopimelate decarboxylase n=1 Tax=Hydrogenophaga sp. TaxID=1904254 RepID=UPI0019A2F1B4|nr:diaminopimelate decarboxylase [Hydrogenophaga sp.]MBD3893435.1 diaminopimelate decarboxylase [Hydrogenophaga sp.]